MACKLAAASQLTPPPSLSHTHTHTHTLTISLSHTHTHLHTHTLTHSQVAGKLEAASQNVTRLGNEAHTLSSTLAAERNASVNPPSPPSSPLYVSAECV